MKQIVYLAPKGCGLLYDLLCYLYVAPSGLLFTLCSYSYKHLAPTVPVRILYPVMGKPHSG